MSCPTFTLTYPGYESVQVGGDDGLSLVEYAVGAGGARVVSSPRPNADGVIDTTRFSGGGVISFVARGASDGVIQQLRRYGHPALRPVILLNGLDGYPEALRATVRPETVVMAPSPDDNRRGRVVAIAQFVVPSGILESAAEYVARVNASGDSVAGFTFNMTFDLMFPPSSPSGEALVTNAGDRDAYPLLRLYGPWSGLTRIENRLTGQALVFDGLSVLAGEFLEVDTRERTIRLNGDPTQSRYDRLVFPASAWWTLVPGEQRVRFVPTTFTAPANVEIIYRSAWS